MEQVKIHGSHALPGVTAVTVTNSQRKWREVHESFVLCAVMPPDHGQSSGTIRYRRWSLDVEPGRVLLMEPGEVHVTQTVVGTANFRLLHISADAMDAALGCDAPRPLHFRSPTLDNSDVFAAVCAAHDRLAHGQDACAQEAVDSLLSSLIPLSAERASAITPALRREVKQIAHHLRLAHQEPHTLQALAERVGLSRFRLVQVFTEQLGLPPMQYLLEWRLQVARRQLERGCSVAQAAHEAGFYDQAQLARLFKRARGMTPRAYRRAVRQAQQTGVC